MDTAKVFFDYLDNFQCILQTHTFRFDQHILTLLITELGFDKCDIVVEVLGRGYLQFDTVFH